jgi:hypothetical protein
MKRDSLNENQRKKVDKYANSFGRVIYASRIERVVFQNLLTKQRTLLRDADK